jgi:glycosyltransferase involved in cell wall biosynthesis
MVSEQMVIADMPRIETNTNLPQAKKIMLAYYASDRAASEYRSGMESIAIAQQFNYTDIIVSDVEHNLTLIEYEERFPGLRFHIIPSLFRSQKNHYRFTDVSSQFIWRKRVRRYVNAIKPIDRIWLQNGAVPWLPPIDLLGLAPRIAWGPVGGGDAMPAAMRKLVPIGARVAEAVRLFLEQQGIGKMRAAIEKSTNRAELTIAARTPSAKILFETLKPKSGIPIIPEIPHPLKAKTYHKEFADAPHFLWIGQAVPRKNLPLALDIYKKIMRISWPGAKLSIYGPPAQDSADDLVNYMGWAAEIPWQKYASNGVLLLTSYREGLPSVVLEALSHGLFVVALECGSLQELQQPSLHLLPNVCTIDDLDEQTVSRVIERIQKWLSLRTTSTWDSNFLSRYSLFV